MPTIQVLDSHVADLIAAGEVVERPASVAKELMENAIDAGASKVVVEISHGGLTFLRVTDDGKGIPAGELKTAFLRHATSKLRTAYDLEAIGTLGFRGEALAAISAVSRVEVMTRTADAPLGASLSLEGGVPGEIEEAGCPLGTTMVLRDLFYNTPARLKFMKKDSAEGAAVFAVVQRVALSHPEVSVKFIRDGKQELLTPGDGALQSAVYAVLGRELALGFREVKSGGDGIQVTGFVSQPACCRASRNWQFFFVNGRQVKSRLLMAALEQAYQNQKMVGKFPACVLHVEVKLSQVDVNVHPAKTEVKFGSEREVFNAVYHAVLSVLEGDRSHPQATFSPARPKQTPGQTTMPGLSAQTYRQLTVADVATPRFTPKPRPTWTPPPAAAPRPSVPKKAPYVESGVENLVEKVDNSVHPVENLVDKVDKIPQETLLNSKKLEKHAQVIPSKPQPQPIPEPVATPEPKDEPVEKPVQMPEVEREVEPVPEVEPWRLAGEVLNTYIIVEQGDKILLIDKHAAHERMNFDRMKAQGYQAMAQTLLSPAICRLAPEEQAVLLSNLPLLEDFGFQVDDFGGGALAVREAPDYLDVEDIPDTLSQLAQKLLTTGHADPDAARDELLHTMACKAAIKGGWKTSPQELERVAQAVMDGSVKYCPHGRPVAIELTRKELEKQFKRA